MNLGTTRGAADEVGARPLAQWRLKGIGLLRIGFGVVWGFDAWFKWQPDFTNNITGYLTDAQARDGQPALVKNWIGFWVNTVNVDPHLFAYVVAVAETLLAIALILGIFSNLTYVGGSLLALVIWSTAQSFGGPYAAGSTDIGAAIIYVLVFAGLFLSAAGRYIGLDRTLSSRLGRLGFLASGTVHRPRRTQTRVPTPAIAARG
jgi:thiosulfate dehydrogenase (quinone) large subunit